VYPILLRLGSFELRSYSVIVALATLAGYWVAQREAQRRGWESGVLGDFAPLAVVAGIVGARLYYVAFFDPAAFVSRPLEVLAIWNGGLAVHGALVFGLVAAIWYCRARQIEFLKFADVLVPGVILGQGLGRLACFLNGDAYGITTDVPWAVTFTDPDALAPLNVPLHPTQLYEMGLDLLLFALIWTLRKRLPSAGSLFVVYLTGYGAIRFVVESFRGDQLRFANGLSAAQLISGVAVLCGLLGAALLVGAHRRVGLSGHRRTE